MLFQAFSSALVSPGVTIFPCLSAQYGTVMVINASASCSTILATALRVWGLKSPHSHQAAWAACAHQYAASQDCAAPCPQRWPP